MDRRHLFYVATLPQIAASPQFLLSSPRWLQAVCRSSWFSIGVVGGQRTRVSFAWRRAETVLSSFRPHFFHQDAVFLVNTGALWLVKILSWFIWLVAGENNQCIHTLWLVKCSKKPRHTKPLLLLLTFLFAKDRWRHAHCALDLALENASLLSRDR